MTRDVVGFNCRCNSKFGDNPNCPRHGLRMKVSSSSPSYTLAELRGLTKQFLDDMQNHGHATTYGPDSLTDWKFETFLQWLAKREREGSE